MTASLDGQVREQGQSLAGVDYRFLTVSLYGRWPEEMNVNLFSKHNFFHDVMIPSHLRNAQR